MDLTLDAIKEKMTSPRPRYLQVDEAVCYIAWMLTYKAEKESYYSELLAVLPRLFPTLTVSTTVMAKALDVCHSNDWIFAEWGPIEPHAPGARLYLMFNSYHRKTRDALAKLWLHDGKQPVMSINEAIDDYQTHLATLKSLPNHKSERSNYRAVLSKRY